MAFWCRSDNGFSGSAEPERKLPIVSAWYELGIDPLFTDRDNGIEEARDVLRFPRMAT